MEAVWPNVHVGEDSLFQCIREIRTALGDDKRQVVRVISGRGYLFQAEVTEAQVTEAGVTEVAVPAAPEIAPVSQPEPAAPDTTAAVATNSEPAKRLFRLQPASHRASLLSRGSPSCARRSPCGCCAPA